MELAEVKKYFENADKVQDHRDKGFVELEKFEVTLAGSVIQNPFKKNWLVLWHPKKGFAKILTTKEPSFSISKDQIRQLTDPKVKEWFPEVFSLSEDFTGWVKTNYGGNKKYLVFFKEGILQYGFDGNGTWFDCGEYKAKISEDLFEATEEEVFEALKNEAVKRGFVELAHITPMYADGRDYYPDENIINKPLNFHLKGNTLGVDGVFDGYRIFVKGKWAAIIQTITKSEAEKLLNKKIID